MNYEGKEEREKLVSISQEVLIGILEENKHLKSKINDLENIIGNLSRKCQREKHKNKQLKTILYNTGKKINKENEELNETKEELKGCDYLKKHKTVCSELNNIYYDDESDKNKLYSMKNSLKHCK